MVRFTVNALQPHFRRFRAIARPGLLSMPRHAFARLDDVFEAAYHGKLSGRDANKLFRDTLDVVAQFLPEIPQRADQRIDTAIAQLRVDPDYPLDKLAADAALSYHRMSHLFADVVGLPLRNYQLWLKVFSVERYIGTGRSFTQVAHDAGFHDSQHLNRSFIRLFDAPPSYFLRSKSVRCILAAHGQESR